MIFVYTLASGMSNAVTLLKEDEMKMFLTIIVSLLLSISARAENSTQVGDYVIYHNALTTDTLTPEIASGYNIQRSKSRALINIAVQKINPAGANQPVNAQIRLTSRSLVGHLRDIPMREVREDKAIYYIADFPVADREHLLFDVEFVPEGTAYPLRAKFEQEFYTQ